MVRRAPAKADLVKAHLDALQVSSELTQRFRRIRESHVEKVTVEGIIAALHRKGINPVLMGAHGLVVYRSETRSTQDTDLLVTKRDLRKTVNVLEEVYPYLEVRDLSGVTEFVDPVSQKALIDVIKPVSQLMRLVFRHTVRIGKTHRIPDLEMSLICKLSSIVAPNRRQSKKQVDLGDLIDIVEHNRGKLDLAKLERLGNAVFPKGGDRMLQMVEDIDAGRTIRL